jgi:hypothetical protein
MDTDKSDDFNDYIAAQTTRIIAKTALNNVNKEIEDQTREQKYSKNTAVIAMIIFTIIVFPVVFMGTLSYFGFFK